MPTLGLERHLVDAGAYERTVGRFTEAGIVLPTFAELAEPSLIPDRIRSALRGVDPDEPNPLNLFRVHWFNDDARSGMAEVPSHVVLPSELTGVDARIVVALGDRFPMIHAHKVLAAYACLAPRVVTGQFDPTVHRAIWPSTGNYCRGGVAISRLMRSHGVAILPEGMSRERFDWLEDWVIDPATDIIRTPGTESNVKEIYDKCAELSLDPQNVIFNQFSEFGNHLAHYLVTGSALEAVFEHLAATDPSLRLRAFTSATGSAGTIGAGDYLKDRYGTKVVAVEALECPTMLANGFGEHNIQGIGDKHIPFIHNVMNTDVVTAVSDRATDHLALVFGTTAGLEYLRRRRVPEPALEALSSFGLSSICNVLAAVKTAKYLRLGPDDVVATVATDGARMYASERERIAARDYPEGFDEVAAGEAFGRWMLAAGTDDLLETTLRDRERIFNLGYFTWVEQQGVSIEDFVARRDQSYWQTMRSVLPEWDEMIREFNARTKVLEAV